MSRPIPRDAYPALAALAATGALLLALVFVGISAPAPAAACAPHTQTVNAACVIIVEATATAAPAAALAPIDGLFDYRDPATRTQVDPATIACIDGSSSAAPGMVLVAVGACDDAAPHAWVREADVPHAVGVRSVADLAPAPTAAPAQAVEYRPAPPQQQQVEYAPPAEAAPTAAPTWEDLSPDEQAAKVAEHWQSRDAMAATHDASLPAPGDAGFKESFRDPQSARFAATFAAPDCAPIFVGYLPDHPCYQK